MTGRPRDLLTRPALVRRCYLQRYAGKTFVIKYGGHAMEDPEAPSAACRRMVLLKAMGSILSSSRRRAADRRGAQAACGIQIAVRQQTASSCAATMSRRNDPQRARSTKIRPDGLAGRRRADRPTSGKDANLVLAESAAQGPIPIRGSNATSALGFVSRPVAVDPTILQRLAADNFIPIMLPVARPMSATTTSTPTAMARAIAGALAREELLPTDVARCSTSRAATADLDRPAIERVEGEQDDPEGGMTFEGRNLRRGDRDAGSMPRVFLDSRVRAYVLLNFPPPEVQAPRCAKVHKTTFTETRLASCSSRSSTSSAVLW